MKTARRGGPSRSALPAGPFLSKRGGAAHLCGAGPSCADFRRRVRRCLL